MTNFPAFADENMGGLFSTFKYIKDSDFSEPDIVNNVISEYLSDSFFTGLSIIDSLNFVEDFIDDNAGGYFRTTISGIVPKLTPEYLTLFNELRKYRHVLLIMDNNRKRRIVGAKNKGMTFSFKQSTKAIASGLNGFEYTFTLSSDTPSPFYTNNKIIIYNSPFSLTTPWEVFQGQRMSIVNGGLKCTADSVGPSIGGQTLRHLALLTIGKTYSIEFDFEKVGNYIPEANGIRAGFRFGATYSDNFSAVGSSHYTVDSKVCTTNTTFIIDFYQGQLETGYIILSNLIIYEHLSENQVTI